MNMNAPNHRTAPNQGGFTLIEIIAVLILLSTIAAIVVPKFIDLDANAKVMAIESGISELNGRENLVWTDIKMSNSGWLSDAQVFAAMDYDLGSDYDWSAPPTVGSPGSGTLRFQDSTPVELERSESRYDSPSKWTRK
jgi:prepilin-type N-terminal cleavage/methylation domain-containing protein